MYNKRAGLRHGEGDTQSNRHTRGNAGKGPCVGAAVDCGGGRRPGQGALEHPCPCEQTSKREGEKEDAGRAHPVHLSMGGWGNTIFCKSGASKGNQIAQTPAVQQRA